jgi:hypothetical protein
MVCSFRATAFALVGHAQGFTVVALSFADIARNVDVGQEMHLNADHAVTLAGLASSPLHVKAETSRFVAPGAGLLRAGKQVPDRGEQAGIRGRVGTRGSPDGRLVDIDNLVEQPEVLD